MNPRKIAVKILTDAENSQKYVDAILHRYFKNWRGTDREKRFIQEIVFGTVRWQNKLDFMLGYQYQGQYHKAEHQVKALLRSGLYQMLMMDGVPQAVAINETVETAKQMGRKNVAGLINGVLRAIKRNEQEINKEILNLGDARRISVAQSHPEWLVQRWLSRFGVDNTMKLCLWNNQSQRVTVRVNTHTIGVNEFMEHLIKENIVHKQSRLLPEFITLNSAQQVIHSDTFDAAWFAVQDQAAGLAAMLVEPQKDQIILDCCAAPGGKTTYIAQRYPELPILAFDKDEERLSKVSDLAHRLGFDNIQVAPADAGVFEFPQSDWALLDVPCTGTGVLGRRVDARWRRSPADIKQMVQTQQQIIQNVARYIKPGGTVVYSTCTLEPEENWGIVDWFLSQNSEFFVGALPDFIPEEYIDDRGALMVLPHKHQMDGAFGVRLHRESTA